MYFGRWSQNGRSLYNDSCFEFNARSRPVPMTVLKNNLNVNYCSGYRSSQIYRSAPFRSNGQSLSLWVYDTDYRDNKGGFSVVVYRDLLRRRRPTRSRPAPRRRARPVD